MFVNVLKKHNIFSLCTWPEIPSLILKTYKSSTQQPSITYPLIHHPIFCVHSGDIEFVESHLSTLRKEYDFWMRERSITVDGYSLNIYNSKVNQPRPESYREDKEISDSLPTGKRTYCCCVGGNDNVSGTCEQHSHIQLD